MDTQDFDGFESSTSQKELEENQSFTPLDPDQYIIYLAKIDLIKKAKWNNNVRQFEYHNPELVWHVIALVYGLKAGGTMYDIEGKEIKPFSRWITKDINPTAHGFSGTDRSTPSFLRFLICYLNDRDMSARLKTKDFVLLQGLKKVIDPKLREQFLKEVKNPEGPQELVGEGYKGVHDISEFEGRFIGATIKTTENKKGKKDSRLDEFVKLPSSFVPPTAEEMASVVEKFKKSYQEKIIPSYRKEAEKFADAANPPAKDNDALNTEDEVEIEDLPF